MQFFLTCFAVAHREENVWVSYTLAYLFLFCFSYILVTRWIEDEAKSKGTSTRHTMTNIRVSIPLFTACLTDPARVQPGGKMSHPGPTRSQKSAPGLNPQTRDRFHRNPGKNRRNPETETRNPDRIFENPGLTRPVKPETRWTRSKNFSRSGSVETGYFQHSDVLRFFTFCIS